ncbi:MAG: protein kinase, partial [Spirochaetes bacterium]|nr:protein kinase [Spirochaetota bacterium]
MGVVFKAEDTKLDRLVALKFLPRQYSINKEEKQRFIHEAKAAAALDHTNICSIYEIDETEDGQMFIVMAYYDGETLKDKITSGPLPIAEAINITIQVTEGLNKAHTKNIIHRDIKAANIIITGDGIAKIVDFGLAKLKGQTKLTKDGSTLGTVSYMSPEQVLGEEVNHQTDVWSLGVVLYEITIGQFPFKGEHEQAVIYSILNEEPEQIAGIRPEVPEKLEQIIFKALEKEQNNRYQNVKELLEDLQSLAKGPESAISIEEQFQPPPFLEAEDHEDIEPPVFVAREKELEKLNKFLDRSIEGKGQVVFVTGEAGSGKTALVQEFARRAQESQADLVVVTGSCNAHAGIGDPYLPFREVLNFLTGDVEAGWTADTITREHANRLWNLLPLSVETLLETGPDLIGTFVQGAALVSRAAAYAQKGAVWLTKLKKLVERKAILPHDSMLQQNDLFEQYARMLQTLAKHQPILLVLDDLQWADTGSINLLFHLGRRIEGSRMLIIGAYRADEVALGRDGGRHPLETVLNELKRIFGEVELKIFKAEDRQFVDAFLDAEPNRLESAFRDTLFRQTKGHLLFTVELLRGMQEQGVLVKDEKGQWIEGSELNWEALPTRVDAVIEERIGRLPEKFREVLKIASVEGESFTAEVVAQLQKTDVHEIVRILSSELDKRHHLVSAKGIRSVEGQRLSMYLFQHILFQRHLYKSRDEVERPHLHEEVGTVLETFYGEQAEEIAVQLARHFQEAGITTKAVEYLYKAGVKATRVSTSQEAISHFSKGLDLLKTLPETKERTQQELAI